MALVILPILPEGPYGPFGGIRPRELWAVVLFFSGLSFLGHLARRIVGPGQGYLISGLLGGLVSSTSVTFTFARLSRTDRRSQTALAFGAVAANAVLYPRVLFATAALNRELVRPLTPYFLIPATLAAVVAAAGYWKANRKGKSAEDSSGPGRNPLQLSASLQMAVLFQLVMMAVHIVRQQWGGAGVLTSAAVLGFTDVDALTVSMAREATSAVPLNTMALAIAIGVLANAAFKASLAIVLGAARFRAIVGGTLALMILTAGASILIWR
jgi:uncharacterized membrane protein (DUF4010 family)